MSAFSRRNTEYQELFSFDWQFSLGDRSVEAADRGDGQWRNVQLPHDWSIEYPYSDDPEEHGICSYVVTGIGWYRKAFFVPVEAKGMKLSLYFEGCQLDATVYVNGKLAAQRYFGYIPFEADITDLVEYGAENVVTVRVNNADQPNARWYTGSGLYRDVWLRSLHPVHMQEGGTQVLLDQLQETGADLTVLVDVVNETDAPQDIILRVSAREGEKFLMSMPVGCRVLPGVHKENVTLYIPHPKRWSPDSPYLYNIAVDLFQDGACIDRYDTPYGLRTVTFDPLRGMFLNGEHIKLMGVAVHQEGGCVGAAVPKKVWERRLRQLREAGFNSIRTAHNPPDEALLEACDEMGILVMDEVFDEWKVLKMTKSRDDNAILPRGYGEKFDAEYERDVIDFIKRDRNHPCVVVWSCGNEIMDQTQKAGVERVKAIVELFHQYDPSRLVTHGIDHMCCEPDYALEEFVEALDIVGYNYVDRWRNRPETFYEEDKLKHPQWMQLGVEHSALRGGDNMGDGRGSPYWTKPVEASELFRYTMTHDFIIGDFLWTGVDYLGEARWPDRLTDCSVLDTCGYPQHGFWFYKSFLNKECETLHLLPHWNLDVPEGSIVPVLCYTSCDTVELFVNGKSYGKKSMVFPRYVNAADKQTPGGTGARVEPTTANLWLDWDVAYHPGTVKAVGYRNGVKVAESVMETTGAPHHIVLSTDDPLTADGRDIAHVEISIVDEAGRVCPKAAVPLTAEVTGCGTLLGFDASQPDSHEMFGSPNTVSYKGRALLIVRADKQPGEIRVRISGEGVQDECVTLRAEA